jgi:ppGpp synthetase/RelA/SpoT-type nucleotidyltranferase
MNDLETARTKWLEEEPQHNEFARAIADRLTSALRPLGIWFEVSHRTKAIDSLLKKLIRKPEYSYESLPDKVGVRFVVRYRSDLDSIIAVAVTDLVCGAGDDKADKLGEDRVGYQSKHLDHVSLPSSDLRHSEFPAERFWAELQIRTLAQHLWSEMSHDTIYKNDETIVHLPPDFKRRVNLMAGQIEVADREFDRLARELAPEDSLEILKFLERRYYALTANRPDIELSVQVLRDVLPLYRKNVHQIEATLDNFLVAHNETLKEIYAQVDRGDTTVETPFIYQPEILVLYERLVNDGLALRRTWNEHYPETELERIANTLGISFD